MLSQFASPRFLRLMGDFAAGGGDTRPEWHSTGLSDERLLVRSGLGSGVPLADVAAGVEHRKVVFAFADDLAAVLARMRSRRGCNSSTSIAVGW